MKLGAAGSILLLAGCLMRLSGDAQAGERACNVKDCFFARDVRNFDVIDKSTLIVYVGSQRCAFRVELRGTFCDLTYAPELVFTDPKDVPINEQNPSLRGGQGFSFAEPDDSSLPSQRRGRASLKVCDNNLGLQVSGGAFTNSTLVNPADPLSDPSVRRDRFGRPQIADCQVSSVASITDDQVVEVYVAHRVTPPLPPMGSGEIQVGKQTGEDEPKALPTADKETKKQSRRSQRAEPAND
jgi:hypothetical protein